MPVRKNEAVVGIIIFTSLIVLFLGLMWLQNYRLKGQGYSLVAHFDEVSGLNRGDPVTVAGLPIGRVQAMRLEGRKVLVRLWIEGKQTLPQGSMAIVKSQGVMGEKYVDIVMGSHPETLKPGDTIAGLYEPDFSQVASLVGNVGDDIQAILSTARSVLGDTTRVQLSQSIADIHSTAREFKKLFSQNTGRLDATISNLHAVSKTLAELSSEENPDRLIPNLEKAARDLNETAVNLRGFSLSLDSLFQPTLRGESTLGRLLSDEDFYRDLHGLITHLDSLVEDIRENPGRYMQVRIF